MSEGFGEDEGMQLLISALLGLATFIALFPFAGEDSDPPRFYSVFGYEVPTGDIWLALLSGAGVALGSWWFLGRRRKDV
jgi:LPXTG-motif cell wall-anchored protein